MRRRSLDHDALIWCWALLLCLAGAWVVTPMAAAQEARSARDWFAHGLEQSRAQRWQEARLAFLRSLAAEPRVSTHFNLAVASLKLELGRETLLQLEAFARLADPDAHADFIREAASLRERALELVGTLELHVDPSSAELRVDGEVVAPAVAPVRRIQLDPGPHLLQLKAAGCEDRSQRIEIARGALTREDVVLARVAPARSVVLPAPARTAARAAPEAPREDGQSWLAPVLITSGALAGVGLIVLIVTVATSDAEPEGAYAGSSGILFGDS